MNPETGQLYSSLNAAVAAGEKRENLVELSEEALANLRRQLCHGNTLNHPNTLEPKTAIEEMALAKAEAKRAARRVRKTGENNRKLVGEDE